MDSLFVSEPSEWVVRYAPHIRPGGLILDVACGSGRHTRFLAEAGFEVEAVDRDAGALAGIAVLAGVTVRRADLENGPWPYRNAAFDGIVVTNYLHRPLFARLFNALKMGGVLIYETFSEGNELLGRPRNPDHLLKSGELLEWAEGRLEVNAYEELCVIYKKRAIVQRICATKVAG
ncbi:MAG: class I SAM-dependent methyltransferase [Sulfuricella sp.]